MRCVAHRCPTCRCLTRSRVPLLQTPLLSSKFAPEFVEERRKALDAYLRKVVKEVRIQLSDTLDDFLEYSEHYITGTMASLRGISELADAVNALQMQLSGRGATRATVDVTTPSAGEKSFRSAPAREDSLPAANGGAASSQPVMRRGSVSSEGSHRKVGGGGGRHDASARRGSADVSEYTISSDDGEIEPDDNLWQVASPGDPHGRDGGESVDWGTGRDGEEGRLTAASSERHSGSTAGAPGATPGASSSGGLASAQNGSGSVGGSTAGPDAEEGEVTKKHEEMEKALLEFIKVLQSKLSDLLDETENLNEEVQIKQKTQQFLEIKLGASKDKLREAQAMLDDDRDRRAKDCDVAAERLAKLEAQIKALRKEVDNKQEAVDTMEKRRQRHDKAFKTLRRSLHKQTEGRSGRRLARASLADLSSMQLAAASVGREQSGGADHDARLADPVLMRRRSGLSSFGGVLALGGVGLGRRRSWMKTVAAVTARRTRRFVSSNPGSIGEGDDETGVGSFVPSGASGVVVGSGASGVGQRSDGPKESETVGSEDKAVDIGVGNGESGGHLSIADQLAAHRAKTPRAAGRRGSSRTSQAGAKWAIARLESHMQATKHAVASSAPTDGLPGARTMLAERLRRHREQREKVQQPQRSVVDVSAGLLSKDRGDGGSSSGAAGIVRVQEPDRPPARVAVLHDDHATGASPKPRAGRFGFQRSHSSAAGLRTVSTGTGLQGGLRQALQRHSAQLAGESGRIRTLSEHSSDLEGVADELDVGELPSTLQSSPVGGETIAEFVARSKTLAGDGNAGHTGGADAPAAPHRPPSPISGSSSDTSSASDVPEPHDTVADGEVSPMSSSARGRTGIHGRSSMEARRAAFSAARSQSMRVMTPQRQAAVRAANARRIKNHPQTGAGDLHVDSVPSRRRESSFTAETAGDSPAAEIEMDNAEMPSAGLPKLASMQERDEDEAGDADGAADTGGDAGDSGAGASGGVGGSDSRRRAGDDGGADIIADAAGISFDHSTEAQPKAASSLTVVPSIAASPSAGADGSGGAGSQGGSGAAKSPPSQGAKPSPSFGSGTPPRPRPRRRHRRDGAQGYRGEESRLVDAIVEAENVARDVDRWIPMINQQRSVFIDTDEQRLFFEALVSRVAELALALCTGTNMHLLDVVENLLTENLTLVRDLLPTPPARPPRELASPRISAARMKPPTPPAHSLGALGDGSLPDSGAAASASAKASSSASSASGTAAAPNLAASAAAFRAHGPRGSLHAMTFADAESEEDSSDDSDAEKKPVKPGGGLMLARGGFGALNDERLARVKMDPSQKFVEEHDAVARAASTRALPFGQEGPPPDVAAALEAAAAAPKLLLGAKVSDEYVASPESRGISLLEAAASAGAGGAGSTDDVGVTLALEERKDTKGGALERALSGIFGGDSEDERHKPALQLGDMEFGM